MQSTAQSATQANAAKAAVSTSHATKTVEATKAAQTAAKTASVAGKTAAAAAKTGWGVATAGVGKSVLLKGTAVGIFAARGARSGRRRRIWRGGLGWRLRAGVRHHGRRPAAFGKPRPARPRRWACSRSVHHWRQRLGWLAVLSAHHSVARAVARHGGLDEVPEICAREALRCCGRHLRHGGGSRVSRGAETRRGLMNLCNSAALGLWLASMTKEGVTCLFLLKGF